VALVLPWRLTGTAMAQEPKVTSLMSNDLSKNPGRGVLVTTAEPTPGELSASHRCTRVCLTPGGLRGDAAEGWTTGNTSGQAFYEGPDDVHVGTGPANFLVFCLKNKGAPVLVPVK
jgi:hypothetical protein